MSRMRYAAEMPWGEILFVSADLSEASAPIYTVSEDDEGEEVLAPTPYQTSDARHCEMDAIMLAVEYCGREWFADPHDTRESVDILVELRSVIVMR